MIVAGLWMPKISHVHYSRFLPAEFCKRLNSSIRLFVFIRVHLWFVVPILLSRLVFYKVMELARRQC